MGRLTTERPATLLRVGDATVRFSVWPTVKRRKSHVLQAEILTQNPWDVIDQQIRGEFSKTDQRRAYCLSFFQQARDFYIASQNYFLSSRPLLLYYSFLNLAKCLIIYKGVASNLNDAVHGIRESKLQTGQREFLDATVLVEVDKASKRKIYDLLLHAIGARTLTANQTYSVVRDLAPQIVIGHRLWALAEQKSERFVRCEEINFYCDRGLRQVWANILINRTDFHAVSLSHKGFAKLARFDTRFEQVKPTDSKQSDQYITYQMKVPVSYSRRPSDVLHKLSETLRDVIWTVVRTTPPYRGYYAYVSPNGHPRLDPLASVYAIIFYLGSVTRYRPHHFEVIKDTKYGMLIDEILSTQGQQFLYEIASHFAKRDVSMPAVVA